jgi:hypothetical protein
MSVLRDRVSKYVSACARRRSLPFVGLLAAACAGTPGPSGAAGGAAGAPAGFGGAGAEPASTGGSGGAAKGGSGNGTLNTGGIATGGSPLAGGPSNGGASGASAAGATSGGGAAPGAGGTANTGGQKASDGGVAGSGQVAGSGGDPLAGTGGRAPTFGGSAQAGGGNAGNAQGGGGGNAGSASAGTAGAGSDPPIVDLFNGQDLTGFKVYRETSATSSGTLLDSATALTIFKVEDRMIRVYGDAPDQSTQARYMMETVASYSKYKLWWEYKWGTKKFAPYTDLQKYPRDAGLLFHIHGDKTQVWPSSIEFQNKEGSTGDIFALYARCTSLARNGGTSFVDMAEGGTAKLVDGSNGYVQHSRSQNFERPDWNSNELQVDGGAAVYLVNGHVVNKVLSVTDKSGKAVTSGPIALQAEHAETYYRNIRIQVLE